MLDANAWCWFIEWDIELSCWHCSWYNFPRNLPMVLVHWWCKLKKFGPPSSNVEFVFISQICNWICWVTLVYILVSYKLIVMNCDLHIIHLDSWRRLHYLVTCLQIFIRMNLHALKVIFMSTDENGYFSIWKSSSPLNETLNLLWDMCVWDM